MDALFRLGRATAAEIREAMPSPPGYSAVRAQLRTLEEKGHLRHEEEGLRYVYVPKVRPEQARISALQHLVKHVLRRLGGGSGQCAARSGLGPPFGGGTGPFDRADPQGPAGGTLT